MTVYELMGQLANCPAGADVNLVFNGKCYKVLKLDNDQCTEDYFGFVDIVAGQKEDAE